MDPLTRTTQTTPKSPLSIFLSDFLGERFGSIRTNSKIVVDNARSHTPSIAVHTHSGRFDSDSIARTSSSSSSSRWDPNVLPVSTERHNISSGNNQRKIHGLESSLLGASYDIPTVPVRRDSPGKWRTKQVLFGSAKKDKFRTQLVRGGDEPPSGENSILPPPCPIRQISLQPSVLSTSNSDTESKAKRSSGTKASSKPRDVCPPPYPVRQASLPSPAFLQPESEPKPFMKSRKKLKASSGENVNRRTKKKKKSKKTKKSRRKAEEKAKKKGSFPHSQRSERLSLKLSEPRSPRTPTKLRKYLRKSLPPKKTTKERSQQKASASATLSSLPIVSPEGRSLGSAFKSLPTSATTTKPPIHSTRLKFHSDQNRPTTLGNHRSLSETLLSCDRDTIESSSTTLRSGSGKRRKQRSQDRKRSPPAQPIRQLSRALFEL